MRSPSEFNKAIHWLSNNPLERYEMGLRAAEKVRNKYSLEIMANLFGEHYQEVYIENKREIDFAKIFGITPSEWFISCQRESDIFLNDGSINISSINMLPHYLFEKSKGSVFHFHSNFPSDNLLRKWSENLDVIKNTPPKFKDFKKYSDSGFKYEVKP